MLPIGGMLMAIFIIKRWSVDEFVTELHTGIEFHENIESISHRSFKYWCIGSWFYHFK